MKLNDSPSQIFHRYIPGRQTKLHTKPPSSGIYYPKDFVLSEYVVTIAPNISVHWPTVLLKESVEWTVS